MKDITIKNHRNQDEIDTEILREIHKKWMFDRITIRELIQLYDCRYVDIYFDLLHAFLENTEL